MTALTVYFSNAVASTVTTDNILLTTTGGGLTNKNSTLGKAAGYGELWSQSTTSAWYADASLPNPDDKGWLWDDTTLADNSASFVAGTWSASVKLNTNTSSVTADIYVRVYRRASNGVFYPIVSMHSGGHTITTTETIFTLSATTTSASAVFQTGDKLYIDQILNVTGNTVNSTTLVLKTNIANSSTLGVTDAQVVSPGYTAIVSVSSDAAMRFRLRQNQVRDAAMRFRLISLANSVLKNAAMRFRLSGTQTKDAAMRFRLLTATLSQKDAAMRLRTRQQTSCDASMRFRLSPYAHLALFPTPQRRTGVFPTPSRRQTV